MGININNIRYVYDYVLIADSKEKLKVQGILLIKQNSWLLTKGTNKLWATCQGHQNKAGTEIELTDDGKYDMKFEGLQE